jgi:hypothetical protein
MPLTSMAIAVGSGATAWPISGCYAPAGESAPHTGIDATTPLVVDLDATLVTAHSASIRGGDL